MPESRTKTAWNALVNAIARHACGVGSQQDVNTARDAYFTAAHDERRQRAIPAAARVLPEVSA